MNKPRSSKLLLAAGFSAAAIAFTSSSAQAQSADALIDKLVDKGVLTVDEAQALRDEADKDFTKAYSAKSGLPEWATAVKFNGDLRGRFDGIYRSTEPDAVSDRNRLRYRLRFGVTANLMDSIEVGFRLASGDAEGGIAGNSNPISSNQSLDNNGIKKGIYIDLAYAKWSPINTREFQGGLTLGKMENPFVFSDIVFDSDYTPEGFAGGLSYQPNDAHIFKVIGGGFVLKEASASSNDGALGAAQVRWDAIWSKKITSSVGFAALVIVGDQQLTNGAVANVNFGNTRIGGTGSLASNMNPYVGDASVTYTLESFPFYAGPFPIKFAGDFMQNPGAPSDRNTAYSVGMIFGKSGKKGLWEIGYRYRSLEADAWYEEMVDSDTGAYYGAGIPNSGAGAGYRSGTNNRGHIVKASYSPYDSLTLGVSWYNIEAINEVPGGSDSQIHRIQVDAAFKF